jgi:hypothetical protein
VGLAAGVPSRDAKFPNILNYTLPNMA